MLDVQEVDDECYPRSLLSLVPERLELRDPIHICSAIDSAPYGCHDGLVFGTGQGVVVAKASAVEHDGVSIDFSIDISNIHTLSISDRSVVFS